MDDKKLFELLTLVDGVRSTRWETVMQLVEAIKAGGVTIKKKEWRDSFKQNNPQFYPLDLANRETWSTYDYTCIDIMFTHEKKSKKGTKVSQLVCNVKIYEGYNMDGRRLDLRFEALLWLPSSYIQSLENRIMWAFDEFLEDEHKKHLEEQKKLWINKMKNGILKAK